MADGPTWAKDTLAAAKAEAKARADYEAADEAYRRIVRQYGQAGFDDQAPFVYPPSDHEGRSLMAAGRAELDALGEKASRASAHYGALVRRDELAFRIERDREQREAEERARDERAKQPGGILSRFRKDVSA
jgi:hypothetical protein